MVSLSEAGCGQKLVRWLFIIFNIVFTVIGIVLVGVGSYGVARVKKEPIDKLLEVIPQSIQNEVTAEAVRTTLTGVAGTIVTVGLVIMLISSCGWIGACKQNTCLLFTFSVFMVIIVLLELILGITVLVVGKKLYSESGETWVKNLLEEGSKAYNDTSEDTSIEKAWDLIQSEGKCCGAKGPNDWIPYGIHPPPSCKDDKDGKFYQEGCLDAFKDAAFTVSKALGGVAVAFCLIEITGIVLSCYLAFSLKKGSQYEQH